MKNIFSSLILLFVVTFNYVEAQTNNKSKALNSYELHYDLIDNQEASRITLWLNQGQQNIIQFFGTDFKRNFNVYLFSNRDSLDKQWQKDWNMPGFKSQCWMVASGIAHRLDILSPRKWSTQACEHDAKDTVATKKIIFHEIIHVFNGQHNPSPTFENIVNIDWFVEGVAVYASGQLDEKRYKSCRDFIIDKGGPNALSEIWKGENKYGLAGSLVKYIDNNFGRTTLVHFLSLTTATEMLDYLKISEEELISKWKKSISLNETVLNNK
jgi:hypothetical protein